jgi:hypothetical protein
VSSDMTRCLPFHLFQIPPYCQGEVLVAASHLHRNTVASLAKLLHRICQVVIENFP